MGEEDDANWRTNNEEKKWKMEIPTSSITREWWICTDACKYVRKKHWTPLNSTLTAAFKTIIMKRQ